MKREDSTFSPLFLILFGIFLTCLLVSNVIAGKLVSIFGLTLPSAVILFPITYILGDIFTEVYGFKRTRLIIWIGFGANILMSAVFLAAIALPFPSFFKDQAAYATVLGMTPRVVLASLVAYWMGEFANSITLSLLKKATQGKFLWTRTVSSTVVGQAFDTAIFISIGFAGIVPGPVLAQMIAAQYLFKVVYEVVLTPVTYLVVGAVKRREGVDTFDKGVAYNPFRLGGKWWPTIGSRRWEPKARSVPLARGLSRASPRREGGARERRGHEPLSGHRPARLGDGAHRVRAWSLLHRKQEPQAVPLVVPRGGRLLRSPGRADRRRRLRGLQSQVGQGDSHSKAARRRDDLRGGELARHARELGYSSFIGDIHET